MQLTQGSFPPHALPSLYACLLTYSYSNTLWLVLLHLVGNKYPEIRERALRLVCVSISVTSTGNVDSKLTALFESTYQGFDVLADQLAQYYANDAIVDGLLSMLFWTGVFIPRPYGNASTTQEPSLLMSPLSPRGDISDDTGLITASRTFSDKVVDLRDASKSPVINVLPRNTSNTGANKTAVTTSLDTTSPPIAAYYPKSTSSPPPPASSSNSGVHSQVGHIITSPITSDAYSLNRLLRQQIVQRLFKYHHYEHHVVSPYVKTVPSARRTSLTSPFFIQPLLRHWA